MQTYLEFIAHYGEWPTSAYVKHPEFRHLYLRRSPSLLYAPDTKCITIANVEAKKKHTGSFTRLANELLAKGFSVLVENVHTEQFSDGLLRAGFTKAAHTWPPSFLKHPTK